MLPKKACKYCKEKNPKHWPYTCRQSPKTPKTINRVGKVTAKWIEFRHEWVKANTNASGTWECYLQKHPYCPKILTISTLTLDHRDCRSGNPSKRLDAANLEPCCIWDNQAKGSMSVKQYLDS